MKQKLIFLIVICLLCVVSGCGDDDAPEKITGTLNPDSGPVLATIDGEDFHYATRYLFFRDLALYPDDPLTAVPEETLAFQNYGELALGYELLFREGQAAGFEPAERTVKGGKIFFENVLTDRELIEENTKTPADAEWFLRNLDDTKKEYGLKSDEELVELTAPINEKGVYAQSYFIKIHHERTNDSFDREENRVFWEELYGELKEKYNVEYVMEF